MHSNPSTTLEDILYKGTQKLTALGINIFAGGFTLGVEQAGYRVVGQWEECSANSRTFDLNFGTRIARPLKYSDWPLLDAPRLHLVYANPPCAPWSAANTAKGRNIMDRMADPRLAMTARTMETAMMLEPETFVLESVARAYSQGRSYYDRWAERWLAAGYGVTYYVTDAILAGAPSTRERFHFIAHRHELKIPIVDKRTFMPKTFASVCEDIMDSFDREWQHVPKRHGAAVHEQMRQCKEGEELRGVGDACARWSFLYRKGVWDAPAYTVIGVNMQVHPRRPRLITTREGLRLCGYPDDFKVHPSEITKAPTQAVLPPVGKHIGLLAARSLDNGPAQRELEIVDHREYSRAYRPTAVLAAMEEEL